MLLLVLCPRLLLVLWRCSSCLGFFVVGGDIVGVGVVTVDVVVIE